MALQQIYWLELVLGGRTSGREIDLANGADVIREVRDASDDAVELRLVDLARVLQRFQPAMRFFGELFAELLPRASRGSDGGKQPAAESGRDARSRLTLIR